MSILAWAGWLALAVGAIGTYVSFDRLVDIEYSLFPEKWKADGRPYGGRETRRKATILRSGLARSVLMFSWMDHPPSWVQETARARVLLRSLRLFNALAMAGILVAFVASLLPTLAG